MQVVEVLLDLLLGACRVQELHLVDGVHDVAVLLTRKEHLDLSHGHLLLAALLRVKNHTQSTIVEEADGLHHADGLPERAVVVVLRERVLLQELILDDLGSLYKTNTTTKLITLALRLREIFDLP